MNCETRCYLRNENVDGIGPWTWVRHDQGAWKWPKEDWETSHKKLISELVYKRPPPSYWGDNNKKHVAIQAGGCMGMYPRLLSPFFDAVYTFEPNHLNFYCLSKNCQSSNIFKFQAFLGNEKAMVGIKQSDITNCGQHKISTEDGDIPMLRIDDFGFKDVDLIWLDTEGSEFGAIQGAEQTIRTWKPIVLAENGQVLGELMDYLGYEKVGMSCDDTIFKSKN